MKIVWEYLAYLLALLVLVFSLIGLFIAIERNEDSMAEQVLQSAYQEGKLAFQAGFPSSSIPYKESRSRVKWLEGWVQASKELNK